MKSSTLVNTTTFKTDSGEYNLICSFYNINPKNKIDIFNLIDSIKNNSVEEQTIGYIDIENILELNITSSINNLFPNGYIIIRDTKCQLTNLIGKNTVFCIIRIDKLTPDSASYVTDTVEFDSSQTFQHIFITNLEIINKLQDNNVVLVKANLYSILELLLNRKINYSNYNKTDKRIVTILKDLAGYISINDLIDMDLSIINNSQDNTEIPIITSNNTSVIELFKYIAERSFSIENIGLYYIYNNSTKKIIPFFLKPYIMKKTEEIIKNSQTLDITNNNSASNYIGFLVSQNNSSKIININQNIIKSLTTASIQSPIKSILDMSDYIFNNFNYLSEDNNFIKNIIKSKNIIENLNFANSNSLQNQTATINSELVGKSFIPENIVGNLDNTNNTNYNFSNIKSEALPQEEFIYRKINNYLVDNSCNIIVSGSLIRNPGDLFYIMALKTASEQLHPADFACADIWIIIKQSLIFKDANFFNGLALSRFMTLNDPINAYNLVE